MCGLVRSAGFAHPGMRPLEPFWGEEETFEEFWRRHLDAWGGAAAVPPNEQRTLKDRLEGVAARWATRDGRLRYPVQAFLITADAAL